MTDQTQIIPLENATRATIDISKANVSVVWRDDIEHITVSGRELTVERAGNELFLRAERSGRGLFDLLPNINAPGVSIDWRGEGSSIEVSDDEGVIIRSGLGRNESAAGGSSIVIDMPTAITVAAIEIDDGDLMLSDPTGKVDADVKRGDFRSAGGNAEMDVKTSSGSTRIRDFMGSLDIMGGSGDIELRKCLADVILKAGSGSVLLIEVSGDEFDLMAGSGNVVLRTCDVRAFSCQTGSGDIDITGGSVQEILIRSGSGDIECSATIGLQSHTITTGSGEVSLGIPRDISARIEAFTSSGDIDSEPPLVSVGQRGPKSRRSRRQVGSVGSGEPRAEVTIRTASGDIRLHWLQTPADAIPMPPPVPVPPAVTAPSPPPVSPVRASESREQPRQDAALVSSSDERADVLEALARGEITVDEAETLLDRIEARDPHHI